MRGGTATDEVDLAMNLKIEINHLKVGTLLKSIANFSMPSKSPLGFSTYTRGSLVKSDLSNFPSSRYPHSTVLWPYFPRCMFFLARLASYTLVNSTNAEPNPSGKS